MNKSVALALVLFSVCVPAAYAADASAGNAGVEALIRQFTAAFNKADMKTVKALHTAAPLIVDEVPPHLWSGTNAFDSWGADLVKSEAAEGKTGGQVTVGTPTREIVSGDHAYVVAPATYTFQQKGMKMRERAQLTFVLDKEGAAWKIAAWTWTGPDAKPVR